MNYFEEFIKNIFGVNATSIGYQDSKLSVFYGSNGVVDLEYEEVFEKIRLNTNIKVTILTLENCTGNEKFMVKDNLSSNKKTYRIKFKNGTLYKEAIGSVFEVCALINNAKK